MCEQSYGVESVLQKMQSSLACTICLDLLSNPMTTKCGHTFCRDCLDRLLHGSRSSASCPLCVTSITRRSVKQNKKIASLVAAVRNVISSIKEDCGFQEPNKSKNLASSTSSVPVEEPKLEEDTPIRRGTRKREQVSYFMAELLPNKRRMGLKNSKMTTLNEEGKVSPTEASSDLNPTGDFAVNRKKCGVPLQKPENEEKSHSSKDKNSWLTLPCPPIRSCSSETQLERVEQWLSKNQSIQFNIQSDGAPKLREITVDTNNGDDDDDLESTQIFDVKSHIKNKKVADTECESSGEEKFFFDIKQSWKDEFPSQATTVLFKYEDVQLREQEFIEKSDLVGPCEQPTNKCEQKSIEEEFAKEETGSMVSEKENEKSLSTTHMTDRKRGIKHVLSEPNKITPTKRSNTWVVENSYQEGPNNTEVKFYDDSGEKFVDNSKKPEDQEIPVKNAKNITCDTVAPVKNVIPKKSSDVSSANDFKQQPNSKGHNIRFASEMKPKLLDISKPSKLTTKSKMKKSPGWSRIEGARRDLRSKHTSLDIKGGEHKSNLDSKTENSKLVVDSSQESMVIIEEDQSQLSVSNPSNAEGKREHFKKLRSIVSTLKNKSSDSVCNNSKTGSKFKRKAKSFIAGTKRKEVINDEAMGKESTSYPKESYKMLKTEEESNSIDRNDAGLETEQDFQLEESKNESQTPNKDDFYPLSKNFLKNTNENSLLTNKDPFILNEDFIATVKEEHTSSDQKDCSNMNLEEKLKQTLSKGRLSRKKIEKKTEEELASSLKQSQTKLNEIEDIPVQTTGTEPFNYNEVDPNIVASKSISFRKESLSFSVRNRENTEVHESLGVNSVNNSKVQELKAGIEEEHGNPPMSIQGSHFTPENTSVPFLFKGNLSHQRRKPKLCNTSGKELCHHSIPCELFQVMVKYSNYLASHSFQGGCCFGTKTRGDPYRDNKLPHPPSQGQLPKSVAPKHYTKSSDISTEASIIPESCQSNFEQEVAVNLPDEIPGTTLKLKETVNITENEYLEESDENDVMDKCKTSLGTRLSVGMDSVELRKGGFEDVENSQHSQLSASVLQNVTNKSLNEFESASYIEPSHSLQSNIYLPEDEEYNSNYEDCKQTSASPPNSHSDFSFSHKGEINDTVNINEVFSSSIETNTKISASKSSSESPVNYKRSRRIHTLDSSSSSSDDDLPNLSRPQKKKRSLSSLDSPSSLTKESSQIDSEEMRDFERYDENVWQYYKNKLVENENTTISSRKKNSPEINPSSGNESKNGGSSFRIGSPAEEEMQSGEEDDDLIPGTDEVMKNIDSDMALINEMRAKKKASLNDNDSRDGTIDIYSQDSIMTTSTTTNELSTSTRDLFKKCNLSLNLAQQILNDSLENIPKTSEDPEHNLSKSRSNSPDEETTVAHSEDDDTVNASHSSAFSTQSLIISTQQRNKAQNEVDDLKSKISALEEEMKKKQETLGQDDDQSFSKAKGNYTESKSLSKTEGQNEDTQRDSDLDSEELFETFPHTLDSRRSGITFRDEKNKNSIGRNNDRGRKLLTLICTGLSQSETAKVHTLATALGGPEAKVNTKWSEDTTHVIVKIDAGGTTERTLKYLFGVANGAWVVSLAWVTDSLSSQMLLPEDEYEALDCTGAPGPNRGRRISTPIFNGCQFYLIPPFEDVTLNQLNELVRICGGAVVKRFNESKPGLKLIVVNSEDPDKESNELLGPKKRSKVMIAHDWLIECIGMCSLVSLGNYVIGSPSAREITASGIPESLIYETQELV